MKSKKILQKDTDEFFETASQIFAYYSWFVHISPRLIESDARKDEMIHFRITEVSVIQGFLINLRKLDEFFQMKKKYPDDVRSFEFGFQDSNGFLDSKDRIRIDKIIAHPTDFVIAKSDKRFLTYSLAHQALDTVMNFIDYLLSGPCLDGTELGRQVRLMREKYLDYWDDYTSRVPIEEKRPIKR